MVKVQQFCGVQAEGFGELDRENLIDYDRDTDTVILSPLGVKRVEEEVLNPKTEPLQRIARKVRGRR